MSFFFRRIIARIVYRKAFALGVAEAHSAFGRTYGDPYTLQSIAYDLGRNKGESDD